MKSQVPNELISAYFDGEASPEERAEVERLLAENDEAQRELNEISKISAVLHSFPREFAPVTLASIVEERTNGMSLPKPARDPATRTRDRLRDWKAAVSGGLAMMLLLTVFNHLYSRHPNELIVGSKSEVMDRSRQLPLSKTSQPSFAKRASTAAAGGILAQADVQGMPMRAAEALPNKDSKQVEPDNVSSEPSISAVVSGVAADSAPVVGPSKQDFIKNLQVGNLVQLADLDNNVGVIDLELSTVVDVEKGVGQLRVILEKHDVRPRSRDDKPEVFNEKLTERKSGSNDDEMYMIYTVGTGEQFAEALMDVQQHPDIFRNWSNQQPLQLDAAPTPESERIQIANANAKNRDEQSPVNDEGPLAASLFLARTAQATAANVDIWNRGDADTAKGENARNKDAAASTGNEEKSLKNEGYGLDVRKKQAALRAPDGKAEPLGNAYQQFMRVQRNSLELPADSTNNALNNSTNSLANSPTPPNQTINPSSQARAAYKSAKEAQMRSENPNRLKMLWVLRPSPVAPPAAAAAPTSGQEPASAAIKPVK